MYNSPVPVTCCCCDSLTPLPLTMAPLHMQEKIAYRTGLGDKTAVCPAIQSGDATQLGIEAARFEFGATCFTTIQELLDKTGVTSRQIDFVVTNSSLL